MAGWRFWLLGLWWQWHKLLGLCLVFAIVLGVIGWCSQPQNYDGYQPVPAVITPYMGRYVFRGVHVTAATSDGLVASTSAPHQAVQGCRVGDRIKAESKGMSLHLLPEPCAH